MFKNISKLSTNDKYFNIFLIFCLILVLPVLIPVGYEPGGECFNEWAAARLLLDGDGFPKISLSLGYVAYSAFLMSFLEYDYFIITEYFITFSFFYISLFLLFRSWIGPFQSFLIVLFIMPLASTITGHNMILGLAFLQLYLRVLFCNNKTNFLPVTLFLSCSCNSTFIFILIGHYIPIMYTIYKEKINLLGYFFNYLKNFKKIKFICFNFLVLLYFVSFLNPSSRSDNNHFMDSQPWAPIKITSSFNVATMQINSAKYLSRRITLKEAEQQDWYFTNKELFQDANNIFQAFKHAPNVFVENILLNIKYLIIAPNSFLFKYNYIPTILLSFLVSFLGIIYFLVFCFKNNTRLFWPFFWGISSILLVLILTVTNNVRYNIALYPLLISSILFSISKINVKGLKYFNKQMFLNSFVAIMFVTNLSFFAFVSDKKFEISNWPKLFSNTQGYKYHFRNLNSLVRDQDTMLVSDGRWAKAFFKINHAKVFSIYYLPPFWKPTIFNELQQNITQFWVHDSIKKIHSTEVSTNTYIRYKLYLVPMIEYAKENDWEILNFEGFGQVYRKKNI